MLNHPNILQLYGLCDCGLLAEAPALVSPWMDYGDAESYLRMFPRAPRLPIIKDVASGLVHMHLSNVIHGDLKGVGLSFHASTPINVCFIEIEQHPY